MSQVFELELDDERVAQLQEAADRAGLTPEQFVRTTVYQALGATREELFKSAARETLEENRELFKRLAQ